MAREHFSHWVEEDASANKKPRTKLHKSKYDPKRVPAYSTFGKSVATPVPKAQLPKKKPAVPSRRKQPTLGLKSDKNFIVANAVEVIVASNKFAKALNRNQEQPRYVNKADFGKRPEYLTRVKEDMDMEREMLQEYLDDVALARAQGRATESLPEADREALVKQLKRKWGNINKQYQRTCGGAESASKNRIKERLEKELKAIEGDIKLMRRGSIGILI